MVDNQNLWAGSEPELNPYTYDIDINKIEEFLDQHEYPPKSRDDLLRALGEAAAAYHHGDRVSQMFADNKEIHSECQRALKHIDGLKAAKRNLLLYRTTLGQQPLDQIAAAFENCGHVVDEIERRAKALQVGLGTQRTASGRPIASAIALLIQKIAPVYEELTGKQASAGPKDTPGPFRRFLYDYLEAFDYDPSMPDWATVKKYLPKK